jgi:hypothetical protein
MSQVEIIQFNFSLAGKGRSMIGEPFQRLATKTIETVFLSAR